MLGIERLRQAVRRGRRPDRPDDPRPQPRFRVLGVMAPQGRVAGGQDQDDQVFAPYTTVMKKLSGQHEPEPHQRLGARRPTTSHGAPAAIAHAAAHAPRASRPATPTTSRCGRWRRSSRSARRRRSTMTHAARRHRRRLAGRRRHRHHEHHAGVGHRADARDRPAHGDRRARRRRAAAVPGRGRRDQPRSAESIGIALGYGVSEAAQVLSTTGRR